jgi:hypothetical protein
MAVAVLAAAGLYLFIPSDFRLADSALYLYPIMLIVLLVILMFGDPGRIDRTSRWLRVVTGLLILVITIVSAVSAGRLVIGILQKASFTSPSELLTIGAIVWITNVIAFALWYWHLDAGGPAARLSETNRRQAAFRFPEQDLDVAVDTNWFPQFIDYFALSYNTSTAFGPADVSAIRHWSKLLLVMESAISLVLVALVVARAVNIL